MSESIPDTAEKHLDWNEVTLEAARSLSGRVVLHASGWTLLDTLRAFGGWDFPDRNQWSC